MSRINIKKIRLRKKILQALQRCQLMSYRKKRAKFKV